MNLQAHLAEFEPSRNLANERAGSFSPVIFGESLNCESLKFSFQNMTPGHFERKISLEIDLQNLNIKKPKIFLTKKYSKHI